MYPDYRIISKQSYSRPDTTYNYRQIVFASLVTGFIAIMALTLFNRRMSSLVVDRTKDLKSEIQERVQVEPQVRELNISFQLNRPFFNSLF